MLQLQSDGSKRSETCPNGGICTDDALCSVCCRRLKDRVRSQRRRDRKAENALAVPQTSVGLEIIPASPWKSYLERSLSRGLPIVVPLVKNVYSLTSSAQPLPDGSFQFEMFVSAEMCNTDIDELPLGNTSVIIPERLTNLECKNDISQATTFMNQIRCLITPPFKKPGALTKLLALEWSASHDGKVPRKEIDPDDLGALSGEDDDELRASRIGVPSAVRFRNEFCFPLISFGRLKDPLLQTSMTDLVVGGEKYMPPQKVFACIQKLMKQYQRELQKPENVHKFDDWKETFGLDKFPEVALPIFVNPKKNIWYFSGLVPCEGALDWPPCNGAFTTVKLESPSRKGKTETCEATGIHVTCNHDHHYFRTWEQILHPDRIPVHPYAGIMDRLCSHPGVVNQKPRQYFQETPFVAKYPKHVRMAPPMTPPKKGQEDILAGFREPCSTYGKNVPLDCGNSKCTVARPCGMCNRQKAGLQKLDPEYLRS